jgi:hypothetical protein
MYVYNSSCVYTYIQMLVYIHLYRKWVVLMAGWQQLPLIIEIQGKYIYIYVYIYIHMIIEIEGKYVVLYLHAHEYM